MFWPFIPFPVWIEIILIIQVNLLDSSSKFRLVVSYKFEYYIVSVWIFFKFYSEC